jgi:hypothetical protein
MNILAQDNIMRNYGNKLNHTAFSNDKLSMKTMLILSHYDKQWFYISSATVDLLLKLVQFKFLTIIRTIFHMLDLDCGFKVLNKILLTSSSTSVPCS